MDPIIPRWTSSPGFLGWNLYNYCWNNPISFFDPSGKWPYSYHYGLTLAIGLALVMPYDLAASIATANATVDKKLETTAGGFDSLRTSLTVLLLVLNAVDGTIKKWHFPSEQRLAECANIARTTTDPKLFGMVLHAIQDSYIHAGYSAPFGHGLSLDENPSKHPFEAANAGWFTLELMSDFFDRWQLEVARQAAAAVSLALITLSCF